MPVIGYAYAGGDDREGLARQLDALAAAGCERCYADTGSWRDRPELDHALAGLDGDADCLVVCRLDRLGRSLRDLVAILAELEARSIGFRSLDDGIDTTGAGGPPVAALVGALARYDGVLARERTRADVGTERARERRGERPPARPPVSRLAEIEIAPDLIAPIVGFRHWRLLDGALVSMFTRTPWTAAQMTARCAHGDHDPARTPSPGCTCGVYAYYEPCPRTASALTGDLVGGAVVVWGRVEAHATGVRAEHARVIALDLPRIRRGKRQAVAEIAARLGVPAVPHRGLRSAALDHGAPLPLSLRPPRQRAPVNPWARLAEHDA
ncbi:MAG: recombinase family protein [Solirubrobacteraceae bacterium]|jgi:DNA invertase Pin-like site-specific DNA recombinase